VKTAKLSTIFIHLRIVQSHPIKQRSSPTASYYVFVDENGSNALQTYVQTYRCNTTFCKQMIPADRTTPALRSLNTGLLPFRNHTQESRYRVVFHAKKWSRAFAVVKETDNEITVWQNNSRILADFCTLTYLGAEDYSYSASWNSPRREPAGRAMLSVVNRLWSTMFDPTSDTHFFWALRHSRLYYSTMVPYSFIHLAQPYINPSQ